MEKKYDERKEKRREKGEKRRIKWGEREKKLIIMTKSDTGEIQIFSPQFVQYLLGGKYIILERGGGGGKKRITPCSIT